MANEKELVEDITAKVVAEGGEAALEHGTKLVSADAAFKTGAKAHGDAAKASNRDAMNRTGGRAPRGMESAEAGEIASKLIGINRITKVVKGGRTLRFNAIVVVGDRNGRVAIGSGKAREVTEAIRKAEQDAKKSFKNVPMRATTVPHEVIGRFGTSKVKIMPARPGSGIVAGVSVRAVLDLAGYKDVTAKCYGSTNPTNVVKATLAGLLELRTKEEIEYLRGVKITRG